MFRRVVFVVVTAAVVMVLAVGVSGQLLFVRAGEDALRGADAVVVLGSEHDGRERYGIEVARQVGASAVLLSDPYQATDPLMRKLCNSRPAGVEVLCRPPVPGDTRGEAMMARELGQARGWRRIVVVSWRYHLPRARIIFEQCYSDEPDRIIMRAVPRKYDFSVATWEYVSLYQYAGLAKAAIQGSCRDGQF